MPQICSRNFEHLLCAYIIAIDASAEDVVILEDETREQFRLKATIEDECAKILCEIVPKDQRYSFD